MAKVRFLVSTKKPGLEFRVLKIDAIPGDTTNSVRATLLGAHGVQFERVLNDDILTKYGYAIQVRDDAASAGTPA